MIDVSEVEVRPLTFKVRQSGPAGGRPVLFLHGFPETSWSWRSQLEALGSEGYRAVAFDQRGYSPGARPSDVGAYRVDALAGDVLGVADALGIGRFDLVGHDWGGAVAWYLGANHPERVRTLTVVSTPHPAAFGAALRDGTGDQAQRSSYMQFFATPEEPEKALLRDGGQGLRDLFAASGLAEGSGSELVDDYVSTLLEAGAMTGALNWYRAAAGSGIGMAGAVSVPTLYVWSTNDVALGRGAAEATAEHVEGPYRFEVLEGVSHWVPEQAPDELNRLLLEHLAAYGSR